MEAIQPSNLTFDSEPLVGRYLRITFSFSFNWARLLCKTFPLLLYTLVWRFGQTIPQPVKHLCIVWKFVLEPVILEPARGHRLLSPGSAAHLSIPEIFVIAPQKDL